MNSTALRQHLRVLHVEDSDSDAELVKATLARGGFDCEITRVQSREDCVAALKSQHFNLILADYALPSFDGISALALASQLQAEVPFIFVSGTLGEELAIETLKSGARDYVLKHSLGRLAPAVRRALRDSYERDKRCRAEEALSSSEKRFRLLADVSESMAISLDYQANLGNVARLIVPQMADWCAIYTVEEDQSIQPVAICHIDPSKVEWAKEVLWRYPVDPGAMHGLPSAMQTAHSVLVPEITEARLKSIARDEEHLRTLRNLGMTSYLCVPLLAREKTLGTISFIHCGERRFGSADLELAEDLARRMSASIENAKLYREAQEAIRARDEFLSIASHELKTPLTSLQLEIQMLRRLSRKANNTVPAAAGAFAGQVSSMPSDDPRPAPVFSPEFIGMKMEVIESQIKKLSKLINNLLDVSRIAAGRFEIRLEEVDLTRVVRDVLNRLNSQFALAGCPLKVDASGSVVGHWDRLRVEQMATNLISNALKYGRGKPIEIRVESGDTKARFSVRDHGIGISPEHKSRIFDRFERATASRNYGGLGLGLYIVKQIVDALGGTILVESEPSVGSTFTVELPLEPKKSD